MNVPKLKPAIVIACALALAAAASSPRPAGDPARTEAVPQIPDSVTVLLSAVVTAVDGPTTMLGGAGTVLTIGESGTAYITTLGGDRYEKPYFSQCLGYVGDGAPPRDQLGIARHVWRATFRLVSATMESSVVSVDWSRETASRPGVFKREAGDMRTVTLREGESHTLDVVLTPPDSVGRCGASLRIDFSAAVKDDPRFATRRIAYDLWLLDESPGQKPQTRRIETVAQHGDAIRFSFEPLRWTLPGAELADGSGVEVIAEVDGAIRGRIREDGTIDVELNAGRRLGAAKAGENKTGGIGDGGRKRLRLTPGETLALVLPPPGDAGSYTLAARDTRGNPVTVEFARFLAGHAMSLRLRARPEQP